MFKCVYQLTTADFNNCNVITKSQKGFLSLKFKTTNLLECLNDWMLMLDTKSKIYTMYIDLEKAFDSLTHEKLLIMLSRVGIWENLLTWFSNFMTGRFFNVKVGNVRSEYTCTTVDSGVPQVTMLGPLLFILFINNVAAGLSNSKTQVYVDDSKHYICGDSTD